MDTTSLAQAEQEIADATRIAYDADAVLDDPRWNGLSGRILEDAGYVADYFKRAMHGFPDDPHYVRERTGNLVDAATTLHRRVMESALYCRHLIVEHETDPDDGQVWTIEHGCLLERGHAGEHDHRTNPREQMLAAADELERNVTSMARKLRWAMLNGDDEFTQESLDEIQRDLRDLGGELRHRLTACRAVGGGGE